jgi:hypothetical protein
VLQYIGIEIGKKLAGTNNAWNWFFCLVKK